MPDVGMGLLPEEVKLLNASLCKDAADNLADLLDRAPDDWAADADALESLWIRINALHTEAQALLGRPREATRRAA